MKNDTKLATGLKYLLHSMLLIGVILYISIIVTSLNAGITFDGIRLLYLAIFTIGTLSLAYIVYMFIKITESLVNKNPFVTQNVIALRRISLNCYIITACYLVNYIINPAFINYKLIEITPKGISTDLDFMIFAIAGTFIHVLANVFSEAVTYKEENDYTI